MTTSSVNSAGNINPYTGVANPAPSAGAAAASGVQGLTSNDFLTLMTAQLKNQDPLNPTDSSQFLSQLAQLSTVTGINSMNTTMSSLSASLMSAQALSSASLVGHSVLTAASTAAYTSGAVLNGAVQVPAGASAVALTITDASGAVVRHIAISANAGLQGFSWDGTSDSGRASPTGVYGIAATAVANGATQAASTLIQGTVSSVSLGTAGTAGSGASGTGGVTLNTPELGPVALTSVQQIG
jgi:flagellar basal-body rod modification protein FlgD